MKYLMKISWCYLKSQKLRTLLTWLCVLLAVFLLAVFGMLCSSALETTRRFARFNYGSYHAGVWSGESVPDAENIPGNPLVEAAAKQANYSLDTFVLPEASDPDLLDCWKMQCNDLQLTTAIAYRGILYFWDYSDELLELQGRYQGEMFYNDLIGRMPQKAGEIVLPASMRKGELADMPGLQTTGTLKPLQIGDTLTYSITNGKGRAEIRKQIDAPNDATLEWVHTGETVTATYTVVGFQDGMGNAAYIHHTDTQVAALCQANSIYFRIRADVDYTKALQRILEDANATMSLEDLQASGELMQNDELLLLEMRGDNVIAGWIRILPGILLFSVILLLVMRLIIDNAFEMSAQERVRQFGILRTVGASRTQILILVMMEGIFYALCAIPLAMGGALLMLKALASWLNSWDAASFASMDGMTLSELVTLHLEPWIIVLTIILSLCAILFSTYASAQRVAGISPLAAASFGSPKQKRPKKRKTGHLFGFSAYYAKRSAGRNKKRFCITLLSTMIGVVLLITVFTMSMVGERVISTMERNSGDFIVKQLEPAVGESRIAMYQKTLAELQASGYFSYCAPNYTIGVKQSTDAAYLASLNQNVQKMQDHLPGTYDTLLSNVNVCMMDEATYTEYILPETGISYGDLVAKNGMLLANYGYVDHGKRHAPKLVLTKLFDDSLQDGELVFEKGKNRFNEEIGKVEDVHVRLCGTFDNRNLYGFIVPDSSSANSYGAALYAIAPLENMDQFIPDASGITKQRITYEPKIQWTGTSILLKAKDGAHENAKTYLQEQGYAFDNQYEELQVTRYLMRLGKTILGIFIATIICISIFSIMNTINTSVLNRRRELAMLRAVGMTNPQSRFSVITESAKYVAIAVLTGAALSYLFCRMIMMLFGYTDTSMIWYLLIGTAISLAAGITFALLATLLPLRNFEKTPIMETIREIE